MNHIMVIAHEVVIAQVKKKFKNSHNRKAPVGPVGFFLEKKKNTNNASYHSIDPKNKGPLVHAKRAAPEVTIWKKGETKSFTVEARLGVDKKIPPLPIQKTPDMGEAQKKAIKLKAFLFLNFLNLKFNKLNQQKSFLCSKPLLEKREGELWHLSWLL